MATVSKDLSAPMNVVPAKSGYSAKGMDTPGASSEALAIANAGIDKGGMRGAGLLAVIIAEMALKKESIDLARDYYKTNKRDFDFFASVHQPAIANSVNEAMSPEHNPTYTHDFYASAPAGMAKSSILDKQWFESRRRLHRHAIGMGRRIDYTFAVQRMHGIVGGWNVGHRYEMTYADTHNNRRLDRILEMGNIGIGVGNIVAQGLSTAVGQLASSYDNLGDTVSTIGNGMAANSGYRAGRAFASEAYVQDARFDTKTDQNTKGT